MNKNVTMILAMAMLIHPHAASQSSQHDSVSEQKRQKIYHLGRDIKPPQVITSIQPSLDEQQSMQLNAGKKSEKAGSAILRIIVGEDGTVRNAKVLQSFNRDLDAKAVNAVKQWKFEPATKKGVPVAVELEVEVDFHLDK